MNCVVSQRVGGYPKNSKNNEEGKTDGISIKRETEMALPWFAHLYCRVVYYFKKSNVLSSVFLIFVSIWNSLVFKECLG